MYILAIETTGAFASVALMKDDKIIGQEHGSDRFSHLQNLMPQVKAIVNEQRLPLDDITAIAVSCGPGSFTGIRIGVSSARALSQALDIPCVEVPSLEALAMNAGAAEYTEAGGKIESDNAADEDKTLI
ncbi:MAG: tRNA (adenosine(37)-N6)-threonylcarbamoyltransferase complex dimerization subunit type 1 TsaB, partial [Clostridiales bacterium]|nr:tRNA (adenosine(37)-N6)-threonylcarbamoyltransferase complex dimerization subunit type 1 TsaB [Clostridiales bacterium]